MHGSKQHQAVLVPMPHRMSPLQTLHSLKPFEGRISKLPTKLLLATLTVPMTLFMVMTKAVIIVILVVAPITHLGMSLQLRPALRGDLADGGRGIDRAIERIHP